MHPWKNLSINILFFGCRHFYHRWNFLSLDLSRNAPAWSVQQEHFLLRSPNVHKMKSITLNSLHKNTDSFLLEATFKYTGTWLYPSISPYIIIRYLISLWYSSMCHNAFWACNIMLLKMKSTTYVSSPKGQHDE